MKKLLIIGVVLLFFGVACSPNIPAVDKREKSIQLTDGNTLYVGGSGPNNYTSIQCAIDNASVGDTVFVYDDNSPYLESLLIDKSVTILGENKYSTIIDGGQGGAYGCNIEVKADSVVLSNFTFLNTKGYYEFSIVKILSNESRICNNIFNSAQFCRGIYIFKADRNQITKNNFNGYFNVGIITKYAENTSITENVFEGEKGGISISDSNNSIVSSNQLLGIYYVGIGIRGKNNIVSENYIRRTIDKSLAAGIKVVGQSMFSQNIIYKNRIEYCEDGIFAINFQSCIIKENIISNCKCGIWLFNDANIVTKNNIFNNEIGLHIEYGTMNIVAYNNITNNRNTGIRLEEGFKNQIVKNNICWNRRNAINLFCKEVRWYGNYWGRTMSFPKIILGLGRILIGYRGDRSHEAIYFYFPNIDIDWKPASEPYEI